ncbi:MAG: septum formation initiator family protein [Aquihabitans sp.]
MGGLATVVLLVGVLFVAGAPWQTYRKQQAANAEADAELARVRAERAEVKNQIDLLDTDEEIRRRARQFFGFVAPGEELYNFLPPATEPIGLPDGWPFIGVERELGAG